MIRRIVGTLLTPALALGLSLATVLAGAQTIQVDAGLPAYQKASGISGNLSSVGSDTLNELMTLWNESFKAAYPGVVIQVEGKGSSTAPPALIAGTAQLGPMSREMKAEEIDAFEKKYGFKPVKVGVALDALAVYVNKDNPIQKMTFTQADAVFSKTRLRGAPEDIATWGQLGLTGDWAGKPLSLYGRNSASGTYGYFKEHVLKKGDFKDTVKEQPGSAAVVQGVTEDLAGIGYSGIGYRTSGVKAVPLAEKDNAQAFEANYENVLAGKYPLSRMLYIYVVKAPGQPLNPLVTEFLKFATSKEGQQIVVKAGFLPLPAPLAAKQLEAIK